MPTKRLIAAAALALLALARPAQAQDTTAFAEQLRGSTAVEVVLYDERLSSVEADHYLHAAGARTRNAKGRRDEVAATIILQAYLDSLRAPPLPPVE